MAPLAALPDGDWKAANSAWEQHSYKPALESYRRFLRSAGPKDPRRQEAFLKVAACFEKLKEPERQREWLEDWLRTAPPGLVTARGCLMLAPLLEFENARQMQLYTRAIDILEPRQDGLQELVQAYTARADHQPTLSKSEADLRRAIELDPTGRTSGQAFLDLAQQYRYRGDSRVRALELLHELGSLRPGTPEGATALLEEARILDDLERYDEALETVETLIQTAPRRAEAQEAITLRDAILSPMVELTGDMLVGNEPTLQLRTRNVTRVQLAVYRVDLAQLLKDQRTLDPARLPVSGRPLADQTVAIQEAAPHAFYEAKVPIPMKEAGAYLVQARSGGKTAASLLVRSNLRLFTVGGEGAAPALWLVRSDKGTPVTRAEVWQAYYGTDDRPDTFDKVRSLRMLDGGLVAVEPSPYHSLVLVKVGEDYAWTDLDGSDSRRREGFVFTDRPLYRPGQKVQFQALVRASLGGDAYHTPAGESFRVRITDPQGNRLQDNTRPANASGAVGGEVTLAPEAALGDYGVEVRQNDEVWALGRFRVEEYRKPDFEVTAKAAEPHYDAGSPAQVTLSAKYFSGEPVVRGKVSWKVSRREEAPPALGRPGLGWFQAASSSWGSGATVAQGQGVLDERGELIIPVSTKLKDPHPDDLFRYEISAEVTDEGRRTFPGAGSLLVSTRTTFLRVSSGRSFWSPGDLVDLDAEAVDPLGAPLALPAEWTVSRWGKNRFERVDSGAMKIAGGRGHWQWKAEKAGTYRVELRGQDAKGRPVSASTTFQVGEEGRLFEYGGVQALPDKDFYTCGELAEVVINTRKPGMDVLLLMGNFQAARRMVVHCPGKSTRVQIPIGADLAPSFSLRAMAMQDGSWLEYERVVEAANAPGVLTVKVEVTPSRQLPGEEGQLTLTTLDSDGKPVSADVAVAVADASVWAVAGGEPESIVSAFYGPNWNNMVSTGAGYVAGEYSHTDYKRAGILGYFPPRLREYFPDTALFKALHTGPDGKAVLTVPYPDSLTTWKVVVRAFTPDSRFGQAATDVTVSKDLLVRMAAPRFLTERDDVTLNVMVQNNFDQPQTARVDLTADGGTPEDSPEQTLPVPKKAQKSVDFPISVAHEGWLVLTATARAPLQSDALKRKLAVLPHGAPVLQAQAGEFQRQTTIQLSVPKERNPNSTRLEISVSATLAGPMVEALGQLIDYPYGCVEQTLSRFVPAACVARAMRDLELQDTELQKRVPQVLQVGLSRLASFQHADGGWGWWKDDPTDPLMTAYVVYGLSLAKQAGYQVSDPMLERARQVLRARWDQLEPDELAWACFALSFTEQTPDAALDKVFANRDALGLTEKFFLAQAMQRQNRTDDAKLILTNAQDFWKDGSFGDDVETNAAALMAYNALAPEDGRVQELARWLLNNREGNGWSTTRASALAVLALLDPLKKEKKASALRYGIFLNGSEVDTRTVAAEDWWKEQSTYLKGDQVPTGDLKLELVAQGEVSGYWSTLLRTTSREENLPASGGELSVRRRYYRVEKAGRTEPVRSGKVVRSGDELIVVLDIESKNAYDYLVLEDYRPAGCEPLGLASGASYKFCSNVEIRDELTAFFVVHLPQGKSQLTYRLRAETPGRYHAMPARLYAMYAPKLRANSEELQLGIVP